jgi:hypothetical protein
MRQVLTGDQLIEYAKSISSKEMFEYFLECLLQDYEKNSDEWENSDLQSYLSGLSRFTADMTGYYRNMKEDVDVTNITWRMLAEMLIAASVYGS